jgi:ABC-type branched-subunit amino acid transport system ATPase component
MARQPSVLLLDEPAAGLNSAERTDMASLIKRWATQSGNRAVVVIEHDFGFVEKLCNHVLALDRGEVVESGETRKVMRSDAIARAMLGKEPIDGGVS